MFDKLGQSETLLLAIMLGLFSRDGCYAKFAGVVCFSRRILFLITLQGNAAKVPEHLPVSYNAANMGSAKSGGACGMPH